MEGYEKYSAELDGIMKRVIEAFSGKKADAELRYGILICLSKEGNQKFPVLAEKMGVDKERLFEQLQKMGNGGIVVASGGLYKTTDKSGEERIVCAPVNEMTYRASELGKDFLQMLYDMTDPVKIRQRPM